MYAYWTVAACSTVQLIACLSTVSGGNSLFPVGRGGGEQSLLNFRQNFHISDNPPPPPPPPPPPLF